MTVNGNRLGNYKPHKIINYGHQMLDIFRAFQGIKKKRFEIYSQAKRSRTFFSITKDSKSALTFLLKFLVSETFSLEVLSQKLIWKQEIIFFC